jgi:hypothetical protein
MVDYAPRPVAARGVQHQQYDELSHYTLTHPDPEFIHQYVVDAFAAQHAHPRTKAIALTFALVALRGGISVADVIAAPPGPGRDEDDQPVVRLCVAGV